ncbi:WD domain, G-beta repeat [Aquisphaera giovannonii]|uniref:WD domain, G-beta repeat n=1 Tax=Aquisphaera giovannonii TaxID=406548 RepID=A0A5B9VWU4_9BACT|nr:hypothetical protein [Aquisphaera giovannonii]QEH32544.1 WD domain, G-beta repeat [Aquisphaera giovannonii]
MSEVICQVTNHADRVELVWSSRGGFFRPYAIAGAELAELRDAAARARKALEVLVHALNSSGQGPMPWEPAFGLVEAGFELYNRLLPGGDDTASRVREWLVGLGDGPGPIELEVVVEELSGNPAAYLSVPWNLVYDDFPEDHESEFRSGVGAERWRPFWAIRYNLTTGRRVEPLKRLPGWTRPRVVAVIDAKVRENLGADQGAALDRFLAEEGLAPVGSLKELRAELRKGPPRLLYWLGHATPDCLHLGDTERVRPGDLRSLLSGYASRERPEGMLAFLNACRTAEAGSGGSFLDVLHDFGFTGAIATERQTIDNFANEFGLAFLRGFLREGKPLGRLLHELRLSNPALGLLYGAHCPPEIRVLPAGEPRAEAMPIGEGAAVAGTVLGATTTPAAWPIPDLGHRPVTTSRATPPGPPLPEKPYPSLGYYDEGDRALFTGRDADAVRFAATLDRPDTRILVLHAESGVGKSSFLRAGVVPYLEGECVGYRFFRRPDGGLLIVQPAKDPVGQLARALIEMAEDPLRFRSPHGEDIVIDLRPVLDEAVGAEAGSGQVDAALRADEDLLADLLSRMSARLPHVLVLVLDQAEELFTLARTKEEREDRDRALRMIQRLVDLRADVKLIVALRTEYYGRLLDHLRQGRRDLVGVRDDLLRDFSRADVIEAIKRPTAEARYGFRYADGVPEEITDGVLALRSENQDSVLPLVQVICTQLYEREKEDTVSAGVITSQDLAAIKGVRGGLRAFAEDAIERSMRLSKADGLAFRDLLGGLYNRQADGTLTTWLASRAGLEARWGRPTPFARVLEAAKSARLLREDEIRIEGDRPRRYIRLGHDALADVAAAWEEERGRRDRFRRAIGAIAGSLALAALMLLLAVVAWRGAAEARARRREAQIGAANLALDRGLALCEQEDVASGLTWLARSLQIVGRDSPPLERVIRANLGAWHTRLSQLRQVLPHELDVKGVSFHPDGKSVLTGSTDRTARIWDASTGEPLGEPMLHPDSVESVAFSHDGRTIATGCNDGSVRLWDVSSQRLIGDALRHPGGIWAITFSPDDRSLLTASDDNRARLWNLERRTVVGTMIHSSTISCVDFSRDGLLAVTADTEVRFWDASTGRPMTYPKIAPGAQVRDFALGPDGQSLLVGTMGRNASLWEVRSGRLIREFGPHPGPVYAVAFSPDGRYISTGSNDGAVRFWEAASGRAAGDSLKHQGWVTSVAFSPLGDTILTGSGDRTARLWKWRAASDAGVGLSDPGELRDAAFAPDGKAIVTVTRRGDVRSWNSEDGSPLDREPDRDRGPLDSRPTGGGMALLAPSENELVVWDGRTRKPLTAPLPHPSRIIGASISRDGRILATSCLDRRIRVWGMPDCRPIASREFDSLIWAIAIHPERRLILLGGGDGFVRTMDLDAGEISREPVTYSGGVVAAAFSPDGRKFVLCSNDLWARVWTYGEETKEIQKFRTDTSVWAVAFDPGMQAIATGSVGGILQFWDISTGKPIDAPMVHDFAIASLRISPDGRSILTMGFLDETARLWKRPLASLDGDADQVASRIRALTGLNLREDGVMESLPYTEWRRPHDPATR